MKRLIGVSTLGGEVVRASGDVDAFIAALEHPLKPVAKAWRALLLGLDPAIGEAIKWNAPSFHTIEHFDTLHLRNRKAVQIILHLGARKRADAKVRVDDHDGLLTWLGPERVGVQFTSLEDLRGRQPAFAAVLRQWMAQV